MVTKLKKLYDALKPKPVEHDLTRRDFLKKGALILGGIVLSPSLVANTFSSTNDLKTNNNSINSLDEKIASYNINLKSKFTNAEKKDLIDVLKTYESHIGDVSKYNFTFTKREFDKNLAIENKSPKGQPQALDGYAGLGRSSYNLDSKEISIAPKEALDDYDLEEYSYKLIPIREFGTKDDAYKTRRKHDFKWVLIHEIAHNVAFKNGFGWEIKHYTISKSNPYKNNHSKTYKRIFKLSEKIRSKGDERRFATKEEVKELNWNTNQRRPEGYPTHYSSFDCDVKSENEVWADTVAYVLTDSHYADNDKLFMERKEQVQDIMNEIKEGKINVVDKNTYLNEHVFKPKK